MLALRSVVLARLLGVEALLIAAFLFLGFREGCALTLGVRVTIGWFDEYISNGKTL